MLSSNRLAGVFFAAVLLALPVTAATFTSVQTGDWNAPSTWGTATFPGPGDTVIIAAPHIVTCTVAADAASVQVQSGATLRPFDGSNLGNLSFAGTLAPLLNATVTVTGFTWSGTFTPNGGTIVLSGPAPYSFFAIDFANLTIAPGTSVTITGLAPLTVTGTLTLGGSLTAPSGFLDLHHLAAGVSSSLTAPQVRISGDFSTAGTAVPFGAANSATPTPIVTFDGTSLQTISGNPFIPQLRIGDDIASTSVSGSARSNDARVNVNASFQPGDASQFGVLVCDAGSNVTPESNASFSVGGWAVPSFTPNGSTVTIAPTSWGAGPSSSTATGSSTFANLHIPAGTTLSMNAGVTVTGTLQLGGTFNVVGPAQTHHLSADAGSIFNFNTPPLRISGNVTTASLTAPFGAANIAASRQVLFNGTVPQTISGNPFLPVVTVGEGGATDVAGTLRANGVTVATGAIFRPGDGSEFHGLTAVATVAPAAGATIGVAIWNVATFTPNGGTVVFRRPSWNPGTVAFTVNNGLTFANLTIPAGNNIGTATFLSVTDTLTIEGRLFTQQGAQVGDVVTGTAAILQAFNQVFAISGDFIASATTAPFGAAVPGGTNYPIRFNGTSPQSISGNPFIPFFEVGDGANATSVTGTVRANGVATLNAATFRPGHASEFGGLSTAGSGAVAPVTGATITAGQWNVGTFTPNGGTVILGRTSWGSGSNTMSINASGASFASLTIPAPSVIAFFPALSVTDTLTIDGRLITQGGAQVHDLVTGSASVLSIFGGLSFRMNGDFTASSTTAPFGAAAPGSTQFWFNGTSPQTITGNPFIPTFEVGDGVTATTVSGTVRANVVGVHPGATFQPGDGSELGIVNTAGSGVLAPVTNATIRVGSWSGVAQFTPNGSTVILGRTSWNAGSNIFNLATGATAFASLTIPSASQVTFMQTPTVADTLTLDGSLTLNLSGQFHDVVAGSASTLNFLPPEIRISGDFTTANGNAPFGAPTTSASPQVFFNGSGIQTISGNPFIRAVTVGDGVATLALHGTLRTNTMNVSQNATFRPDSGTEVGTIAAPFGALRPLTGASVTLGSWNVGSFTANGSTIIFGPTSWGSGSNNILTPGSSSPTHAFANLTILSGTTVTIGVASSVNVSGTLALDGTLVLSTQPGVINRFVDIVAGAASSLVPGSNTDTFISGDITSSSPDAPFGPPLDGAATRIIFNGTSPQTISDGLFIPSFGIAAAATVTGRIRSNNVGVGAGAVFLPKDQSQLRAVTGGTVAMETNGTLYVSSSWTVNNFQPNGGTVVFGPLPWVASPNLTAGTSSPFHHVTFLSTCVANLGVTNLTLRGNLHNDGTTTFGGFVFNGTTPQTITGTGTLSPRIVMVDNVQGVTSSIDLTIDTHLGLVNGKLTTSGTVIVLPSATINRTAGWVAGTLRRTINLAATTVFDVGGATGYSPVYFRPNAGSGPSFVVDVRASEDPHPTPLGTNALRRYWTVTAPGVTNADLRFDYNAPADVPATEASLELARFSGGLWSFLAAVTDTIAHSVVQLGATTFGDFSLAPRAASLAFGPINGGVNPRATVPFPVVVRAVDADGGSVIVTTPTEVTLSLDPANPGSGILGGTLTTTIGASNSSATLSGVTYSQTSSGVRLRAARGASGENLTTAISGPLTFLSLAANHLGVTAPPSVNLGVPFNVTVSTLDANGVVDTGYRGTVHFTTSDPLASGPVDFAFTAGDLGSKTVAVTLQTPGSQSIAFADVVTSTIQGSTTSSVSKSQTTATLTSSPNPSTHGQSALLQVTVQPVAPATATPAGTVTFFDGANPLGTVALSGGVATLNEAALAAGVHSLTATYNGSGLYDVSTSAAVTHTITPSPTITAVAASSNPSVFGQSVAFTVNVTASGAGGGTPAGTVTLFEGATSLGGATLDGSGQATIPFAGLSAGAHSLTVSYGGSANHDASTSSALAMNVGKANVNVALGTSNASTLLGAPVTFTATLTAASPGAGIPSGTVELFDGATSIGTAAVNGVGIASLTVSSLTVGPHSITATFSGDASFEPATSSPLTQTVGRTTPTATLVSSALPSAFGQSVTFTATVSSPAGVPTGTVTFTDGAVTLGVSPLNAGIATLTTATLSLGAHSIGAAYGGDANFQTATASLTQTVDPTATGVVVTALPASSAFGEPVTFTATVTSATAVTPTGGVTFREGATTLGSDVLVDGEATLAISSLTAGSHSIVADYAGDTNNSAGSGSLTFSVLPASSSTAITTSATPSLFGQSVTFTIQITPAISGIPGGTVTISEGATTLATVPVAAGVATYTTNALAVGAHTITATYNGDGNFDASASTVGQDVDKATPSVAVASSAPASAFGQSVTFTATLTSSAGTPTGTITFRDGAIDLGTAGVTGGTASLTTSALGTGAHSITAVYSGDASFSNATSPAIGQTVAATTTSTTLVASASPSPFGQAVTLTATVASSGGTPTGSVAFFDGPTPLGTIALTGGVAQLTTSTLTVGTHLLTATYSGDADHQTSSTTLSLAVDPAPTTTSLASSLNPAPYGTSLTLTATVASNAAVSGGTITFYEGAVPLGTVPLTGASASIAIGAARTTGAYSFSGTFSGTPTLAGSASTTLAQTIDPTPTSVALSSSANPAAVGSAVTFTAAVTASTGAIPTGNVTFFDGAANLATVALSGGMATFSTSALGAGGHAITATYGGASDFLGSTSPVLTQNLGVVVTVSGITPQTICQGAPAFTVTIHGKGFDATTTVAWDGVPQEVTLVDGQTLTIDVLSAAVATAGTVVIDVFDAGGNPVASPPSFTITADTAPPAVWAPPPITLTQTVCANGTVGARGVDSAALAAFLQSATATDDCSIPIPLAPQIGGTDVDIDTLFPGGTTTVAFRYRDDAGHVTPATSSVTVQLLGDLNGDGTIDATDRLVLENFLVGNLEQGTPPFTAPRASADLNGDGNVDATDSLLLANHLVGNIACLGVRAMTAPDVASSASASGARRRTVRHAAGIAVPVRIDLPSIEGTLGSYVARVDFDPNAVTVIAVQGGATSQFAATPIATDLAVANRTGVLRLSAVQLDPFAPGGVADVATVVFVEATRGGIATVHTTIESVATSLISGRSH